MNVKILKVATNQLVGATINKEIAKNLPSMQDNWRFNFNKHALSPDSTAYVLVSEETPDVIEGCMIFQMRGKVEPYMAYLEVAPHIIITNPINMKTSKKNQKEDFDVLIGSENPKEDSPELAAKTAAHFKAHVAQRTESRKIKNELLAIQYRMEEYLDNEDKKSEKYISLEAFLSEFLKILNLSFKKFAVNIDSSDANLKKYLKGDRKFNTELAMKFGNFFHTNPELWLRLYLKNEFIQLNAAKKDQKYAKYDYEKQLQLS